MNLSFTILYNIYNVLSLKRDRRRLVYFAREQNAFLEYNSLFSL